MADDKGKKDMFHESISNQDLSPLQREILKKWQQKKKTTAVSQTLKDVLTIKFDGEVLFDEPMARHTYIKIGGPAEVFLKPRTREALKLAVRLSDEYAIPLYFHGGGANTLVKDGGIKGMVISTYDSLKEHRVLENTGDSIDLYAESGLPFSRLVAIARDLGAADLAPFVGIPGSVGGALMMNAGTKVREIKDVVRSMTVLDKDAQEITLSREKLDFEYRALKLQKNLYVLDATFRLQDMVTKEEVEELMQQFQQRRSDTQPLDYPNLGSIFKNPVPVQKRDVVNSAGQLIEEAGLKNIRVGGARISSKHANFIINEGEATARDVLSLIGLIKDKVKQQTGVILETEIKIIGED